MSDIISVIEAIIAFANLVVIIYFTRKEQRESREREKESYREKRSEMIFDIVIKRLFDVVNKYFDEVLSMVDEFSKKPISEREKIEISPLYNQFQHEKNIIKHMILSVLKPLNEASERKVKEILEQYEDTMGKQLEDKFGNKWEMIRCIDEARGKIMEVLLTIEIKSLK